jgi:hypothetical protein
VLHEAAALSGQAEHLTTRVERFLSSVRAAG